LVNGDCDDFPIFRIFAPSSVIIFSMKEGRVTESHAPVHTQVLVAKAGERLLLGRMDDEWPGWIWCTAESGVSSWVPESFLVIEGQEARLVEDYDAAELTVQSGDLLLLQREVNGWWWSTNAQGREGWVPAGKVAVTSKP
jgi:hypothetical protein